MLTRGFKGAHGILKDCRLTNDKSLKKVRKIDGRPNHRPLQQFCDSVTLILAFVCMYVCMYNAKFRLTTSALADWMTKEFNIRIRIKAMKPTLTCSLWRLRCGCISDEPVQCLFCFRVSIDWHFRVGGDFMIRSVVISFH